MKTMNKCFLMMLFLIAASTIFLPLKSMAASIQTETESNNVMGSADTIMLNRTMQGKLGNEYDEDWYKFQIKEEGYFTLTMGPDSSAQESKIGSGWDFKILDSNRNELKNYNRITTNMSTEKIALRKGTYYIMLEAHWSGNAPVDCVYHIKANVTRNMPKTVPSSGNNTKRNSKTASSSLKRPTLKVKKLPGKRIRLTWKKVKNRQWVSGAVFPEEDIQEEKCENNWQTVKDKVYDKGQKEKPKILYSSTCL